MPKVKVQTQSSHPPQDAFNKVCQMLETDKELHKLDPGYQCNFDSSSLSGTAKGKFFKASMEINEKPEGAFVEILVDLPVTLALAKGMVGKTLQKKLDECLS